MRMNLSATLVILSLALVGCMSPVDQRMVAELQAVNLNFDADACYEAYLASHGEAAKKLREAAAAASTMRFHVYGGGGPFKTVNEYLPLKPDEVQAVREILAEVEETPPHDFSSWLEIQHADQFCPACVPPLYKKELEFIASNGEVLYTYGDHDGPMGSTAKAEEYRTAVSRPNLMLPPASLARWKALPCFKRASARLEKLHKDAEKPQKPKRKSKK